MTKFNLRESPEDFINAYIQKNELGQSFALFPFQVELLRFAFGFDASGRLPWDTLIYSTIKKSGKSFLNGLLTTWWAYTQEAPNELYIVANDLEQSLGRVFKTVAGIIQHNPDLARSAEIQQRQIFLSNGTTITALASDYRGAAGSNHGLVSYDELWAYTSESSQRLVEELTGVPTRRNSIRIITTYAGWEGESHLLWGLYRQGVGSDEHPEGQAERIHGDLPLYLNRQARLLCYWDHLPRMPWQTSEYYDTQRRTLRPGTYLRLHENRWSTAESVFIQPELWDPCVDRELSPSLPNRGLQIFAGVDAAIKHDTAAVVAVAREGEKVKLVTHRIWKPSADAPLDLEATIESYLRELREKYCVMKIYCDPYQLHRSITTLKAAGLPIEEFPQTTGNCTRMGQGLFDLLNGKNLRIYPAEDLRQQALNTVAVENPRGWRIAKEKASKKIDAIVALSMACVAAIEGPVELPPAVWIRCGGETLSWTTKTYTFDHKELNERYWKNIGIIDD